MRWEQKVQFAALTDIGFRRKNNQDSHAVRLSPDAETFTSRGHLFVVADGMGGHAVGELASKIAVDTIPHAYFKNRTAEIPDALTQAIHDANTAVHEKGSQNLEFNRMGTTAVALVLGPNGAIVGHVGDSRLYRIRREQIDQLTFDHSLEWELIRRGQLKPNDQMLPDIKHVITRSIGPEAVVEPEVEGPFPVAPGDIFLACSDGLTGLVKDAEIGAIAKHLPLMDACRLLVNLANFRGGPDNITVILAHVGPLPDGAKPLPHEIPEPARESDPLRWLWRGGFVLAFLMFAVGAAWATYRELIPGVTLAGVSLIALAVIGKFWRKYRQGIPEAEAPKSGSTVLSRAYRTAPAKLTPDFLAVLTKQEAVLKHSAETEVWSFDTAAQNAASQAAKSAVEQKQWSEALKLLAKSLEVLMIGLLQHRKNLAKQAEEKEVKAISQASPGQDK